MAWVTPSARTTGELISASIWNTDLKDNLLALKDGLVGVGFTLIDLLGAGAAPAVSVASHATIYYDTARGQLVASINGDTYVPIGTAIYQNPFLISRWRELSRY